MTDQAARPADHTPDRSARHDSAGVAALPTTGPALALTPGTALNILRDPRIRQRGNGAVLQAALQRMQQTVGNRAARQMIQQRRDMTTAPPPTPQPLPAASAADATGLPDTLKAGVETRAGWALDDVRVHYNSPAPEQIQALAYAQGAEIHVGPGQEPQLAHELWHVVQQKQGRVRPTRQAQGLAISDDSGLEREADAEGARLGEVATAGTPVRAAPAGSAGLTPGGGAVVQAKYKIMQAGKPVVPLDLDEVKKRLAAWSAARNSRSFSVRRIAQALNQMYNHEFDFGAFDLDNDQDLERLHTYIETMLHEGQRQTFETQHFLRRVREIRIWVPNAPNRGVQAQALELVSQLENQIRYRGRITVIYDDEVRDEDDKMVADKLTEMTHRFTDRQSGLQFLALGDFQQLEGKPAPAEQDQVIIGMVAGADDTTGALDHVMNKLRVNTLLVLQAYARPGGRFISHRPHADIRLFSLQQDFTGALDEGQVPNALRKEFADQGHFLTRQPQVIVDQPQSSWTITDRRRQGKNRYIVRYYAIHKENETLNVYLHADATREDLALAPGARYFPNYPLDLKGGEYERILAQEAGMKDKVPGIAHVLRAVDANSIDLVCLYGHHQVSAPGRMYALANMLHALRQAKSRASCVVLDFTKELPRIEMPQPWLRSVRLNELGERLPAADVIYVPCGGVSQLTFNLCYARSTMPGFVEGWTSLSMMHLLDKPYLNPRAGNERTLPQTGDPAEDQVRERILALIEKLTTPLPAWAREYESYDTVAQSLARLWFAANAPILDLRRSQEPPIKSIQTQVREVLGQILGALRQGGRIDEEWSTTVGQLLSLLQTVGASGIRNLQDVFTARAFDPDRIDQTRAQLRELGWPVPDLRPAELQRLVAEQVEWYAALQNGSLNPEEFTASLASMQGALRNGRADTSVVFNLLASPPGQVAYSPFAYDSKVHQIKAGLLKINTGNPAELTAPDPAVLAELVAFLQGAARDQRSIYYQYFRSIGRSAKYHKNNQLEVALLELAKYV